MQPQMSQNHHLFNIPYSFETGRESIEQFSRDNERLERLANRFPTPSDGIPAIYTAMMAGEVGICRQWLEGDSPTEKLLAGIRRAVAYRFYKKRFKPDWKIQRIKKGLAKDLRRFYDAELALWEAVYNLLVNLPAYYPELNFPYPLETLYLLSLEERLIMPYRFKGKDAGTATEAKRLQQKQNKQLASGKNPFPENSLSYTVVKLAIYQAWDSSPNEFFRVEFWQPVVKARQKIPNLDRESELGFCAIHETKGIKLKGGTYQQLKHIPTKS
jgi:hypothetical protein